MSEYVEKCPCCNNHSLEVTKHDWGEERRCELCGFAVAPSLPTQAHVGNAVAFVSAARPRPRLRVSLYALLWNSTGQTLEARSTRATPSTAPSTGTRPSSV